ncbi:unnamed protein product [Anisakis simplex]|uniref:Phosphotriesterase-related protein n=1 Tax=Anisakis simplex TaxID=6269 RepID=A0A0M3JE68_ANISI|nr:unnamed protein product [Anisakis simplex]
MTIERVKACGATTVLNVRSVSECDQEVDNEIKNILSASSDKEVDRLRDCKLVNTCKQKQGSNKQLGRPVTFHLPMPSDDNVDEDCTSSDELG